MRISIFDFFECFAVRDPYLNTGVYVDEVIFGKPLNNLRMGAGRQEMRGLELPDLLEGRGAGKLRSASPKTQRMGSESFWLMNMWRC